jgi:hypothetical protein
MTIPIAVRHGEEYNRIGEVNQPDSKRSIDGLQRVDAPVN